MQEEENLGQILLTNTPNDPEMVAHGESNSYELNLMRPSQDCPFS